MHEPLPKLSRCASNVLFSLSENKAAAVYGPAISLGARIKGAVPKAAWCFAGRAPPPDHLGQEKKDSIRDIIKPDGHCLLRDCIYKAGGD